MTLDKERQNHLLKWFYARTFGCKPHEIKVDWSDDNCADISVTVDIVTGQNDDYIDIHHGLVIGNLTEAWTLDVLRYLFEANTTDHKKLLLFAALRS